MDQPVQIVRNFTGADADEFPDSVYRCKEILWGPIVRLVRLTSEGEEIGPLIELGSEDCENAAERTAARRTGGSDGSDRKDTPAPAAGVQVGDLYRL